MNTRAYNRIGLTLLAGILAMGMTAQARAGAKVTTSGSGNSEREATDQALQKALTAIVDDRKPAYTAKGRKFAWTRRVVQAHPRHVIGSHFTKVKRTDPSHNRATRQWLVTVAVDLPISKFNAAWQEAEQLIGWIKNPTVALSMYDRIEDSRPGRSHETNTQDSDLAQQLREALDEEHFRVKVIEQVTALKATQGEFARLNNQDRKVLTEIRTRQEAQILVTGFGRVMGPTQHNRVPGRTGYDWEADAKCKLYWTDDASLIATLDADGLGEDNDPNRGRITALKNVGTALATKIMDSVFRKWSQWAFEGRTVEITVLGCSYEQAMEIEDFIDTLAEIEIEDAVPANNMSTITIITKKAPRKIARKIYKAEYDGFKLEATATRSNIIELKVLN